MKERAGQIGLVLGSVFIIMGLAYGNSAIWMLGFILLGLGVFEMKKKKKKS